MDSGIHVQPSLSLTRRQTGSQCISLRTGAMFSYHGKK